MTSQPPKLFISYAHKDVPHKEPLDVHLQGLKDAGLISSWYDGLITPGQQWDAEIVRNLDESGVILLLIGPYFMASEYINKVELPRAAERHARGEVIVIPVLMNNVHGWQAKPFGKITLGALQALPSNQQFVAEWQNPDAAYADIAKGIEAALRRHSPPQPSSPQHPPTKAGAAVTRAKIPRPPAVGFVPRRDAQGNDIVSFLTEELAPGKNRLITLSAPGGMGKTTLAAEAARELVELYGDRFVWSDAVRSGYTPSTLLDDVATQLGRAELRQLAPEAKAAAVRELVIERATLIVLDNCETIEPAERELIEEWFRCSQCSALFTSRQMIKGTRNVSIPAMTRDEAEQLLENLIAQTPDPQAFSPEVRQRIYETAEANPYLIEWVTLQIAEAREPQTVFDELARGEGDAAQRVFTRSFNLPQVGDDGRAALLALSLFARSASRPALAAVAGFGDDQKRLDDAVRGLYALGLVKTLEQNSRLTIEGLTRSLAAARLSKDERAAEFRQRFVAYFVRYAEAHRQRTPEDLDALEAERENLLAAIDAAIKGQQWQAVAVSYEALWWFLYMRGYWDEAIQHGQQAIEAAQTMSDKGSVAMSAGNVATIRQNRGEYSEAEDAYRQAIQAFRELGDDKNVAVGLHQLGRNAQYQGKVEEARLLYQESLEIKTRLGNQRGIIATLHHLAMLAQEAGEAAEARRLYEENLKIARQLGDQSIVATTLHNLAILAQDAGEAAEARRLHQESLEIKTRLGDQSGIAGTLHQLGILAQVEGNPDRARELYNESLEIERRLGNQSGIALSLYQLGVFAAEQGDKAEAVRLIREALTIFEKLGSPYAAMTRRNLEILEGSES